MTAKFEWSYTEALSNVGLTKEQARIYEVLVRRGPRPAGYLPKLAGLSRPYVYKILDELEELNVVTRTDPPGKPAVFAAVHPFSIRDILQRRREQLGIAHQTLEGVMGSLISDFTGSSKLPGIRILQGLDGITSLYKDILSERKDIRLLRSTEDDTDKERLSMVLDQIKKQVAHNIHTRIIGPLPGDLSLDALKARDGSRLSVRRVMPRETFSLPSQVIIYGNKVGISAYSGTPITTIIENEAISETFGTLFETIWNIAEDPFA